MPERQRFALAGARMRRTNAPDFVQASKSAFVLQAVCDE
jgi:hypothetical protein